MRRITLIGIAFALGAAAPSKPSDANAVRAAVAAIFAPYERPTTDTVTQASFERPIFSRRTRSLIDSWQNRSGPKDIITPLSGGDWLCQCQDWEPRVARLGPQKLIWLGPNRVESRAMFTVFKRSTRATRLIMVRENGTWLIDDILFQKEQPSLIAQLRTETAVTN
jgi:Protein of unknown function (DUF3828)